MDFIPVGPLLWINDGTKNKRSYFGKQKYELVLCLTTNNESNVKNIYFFKRVGRPSDSVLYTGNANVQI